MCSIFLKNMTETRMRMEPSTYSPSYTYLDKACSENSLPGNIIGWNKAGKSKDFDLYFKGGLLGWLSLLFKYIQFVLIPGPLISWEIQE